MWLPYAIQRLWSDIRNLVCPSDGRYPLWSWWELLFFTSMLVLIVVMLNHFSN
ncbi:MAG: hypothetical protein IPI55_09610 [Flavobacteriales bacterium]|nr:hypothetical protein [Flavobacteriales bacterium]